MIRLKGLYPMERRMATMGSLKKMARMQRERRKDPEKADTASTMSSSRQLREVMGLRDYGKKEQDRMIEEVREGLARTQAQLRLEGEVLGVVEEEASLPAASKQILSSLSGLTRVNSEKRRKYLRNFIEAAKQIKEMKLDPSSLVEGKVFATKPYDREGSR